MLFLVLGGSSALASTGAYRPSQLAAMVRPAPVVIPAARPILGAAKPTLGAARPPVAVTPLAATSPAARPAPTPTADAKARPVTVRAFKDSWLTTHPTDEALAINGRAAIAVDVNAGQILYARDIHTRYADASLTKMMTAMVAIDLASADQVLRVPQSATQVEPNVMGLTAGEQLTVRELLYGLLLDSGNDAAETIAQGITGRKLFVQRMNQKAAALHLMDTAFTNPSGFDEPGHYGSAYDLAVLSVALLQDYPELASIVGTKQVTLEPSPQHKWFGPQNLNRLLWSYPGAIGLKPGFTDDAGYCLAAAATRQGRTIVAVVLGSSKHFSDAATLLDFGFRHAIVQ